MKLSNRILLPLMLAANAGPAFAQNTQLTRAEVKAELVEAIRTGDLLADGETGLKLNEINPSKYPSTPSQLGKTRAQVRAELEEAIRTGDMLAVGDAGLKLNEVHPSKYPSKPAQVGKTRSQVQAELSEARRLGLLNLSDSKYPVVYKPQQGDQIGPDGERAADMKVFKLIQQ
jgi:predicted RNase H-like HicB family nuclease